jgi:peptidyl-dipeptidase Dcp
MKKLAGIFLMTIMIASCTTSEKNPFFATYDTPFGVPPFNEIRNEHFIPAIQEGIRLQEELIEAIINNPEEPTFANTVEALEYSGMLINKVSAVFFNYTSSNISPEIQAIAQELAPVMSTHSDNITLNARLFERIKAVNEQKEKFNLTEEQEMLLDRTYKDFVRNGADLPAEKQERFP